MTAWTTPSFGKSVAEPVAYGSRRDGASHVIVPSDAVDDQETGGQPSEEAESGYWILDGRVE